ncbi:MAG: imidazole glycerol phosphate synthase subunit HisH [Bacillota bacterium]
MIIIIDYGMGNLRSVQKSLERNGFNALISSDPDKVKDAAGLILPGVGAFADAMDNLINSGMAEAIKEFVKTGKPFLGICLGMQLMLTTSEENGWYQGLDLIQGEVLKLPTSVKVPHMGWNTLKLTKEHPLIKGIEDGSYFYFVHSYYVSTANDDDTVALSHYGIDFCALMAKDNIMGVQFHPEKSSLLGQVILKNFGRMV